MKCQWPTAPCYPFEGRIAQGSHPGSRPLARVPPGNTTYRLIPVMSEHGELRLCVAPDPAYEAGAAVLCALAWPELLADPAAIGERHTALCNYCLRLCAAADPDWATAPQLIKPIYLSVPEEQVDRIWREFSRRIAQRQAAARMVIPFLRQASGTAPRLPPASHGSP